MYSRSLSKKVVEPKFEPQSDSKVYTLFTPANCLPKRKKNCFLIIHHSGLSTVVQRVRRRELELELAIDHCCITWKHKCQNWKGLSHKRPDHSSLPQHISDTETVACQVLCLKVPRQWWDRWDSSTIAFPSARALAGKREHIQKCNWRCGQGEGD